MSGLVQATVKAIPQGPLEEAIVGCNQLYYTHWWCDAGVLAITMVASLGQAPVHIPQDMHVC